MPLNLIKLCVGVDELAQLRDWQAQRLARMRAAGETPQLRHVTRSWPRRSSEVQDGGSLYWVIKGVIRVRQPIAGFEEVLDPQEGIRRCAILLDEALVETEARPCRAFQGWRYLAAKDAPPDRTGGGGDDLPAEMEAELRALGIL